MPTLPRSDFVLGESRFALGTLETFFDALPLRGGADHFGERGERCVGQPVPVLGILLQGSRDQEDFRGADPLVLLGPDGGADRLEFERTFLGVSDLETRPFRGGLLLGPGVDAPERSHRETAAIKPRFWRNGLQVAYNRVGRHFQDVAFPQPAQVFAEPGGPAELLVADNPGVRKARPDLLQEVDSDLLAGLKVDLLGNMTQLPAAGLAPFVGKVEPSIDEGGAAVSRVGQVNAHLAIGHLPDAAAPLAFDADGVVALLLKRAGIQDEDASGIAELFADVVLELLQDLLVIPEAGPDEMLERLTVLAVVDGDGLAGLAGKIAEQPLDVDGRVACLFDPVEPRSIAPDELLQVVQAGSELFSCDSGEVNLGQRVARNGKSHKSPLSGRLRGLSASCHSN